MMHNMQSNAKDKSLLVPTNTIFKICEKGIEEQNCNNKAYA